MIVLKSLSFLLNHDCFITIKYLNNQQMKNKLRISAILLVLSGLVSCDKGFDEMNVNPIALTAVDPSYQLNSAIINTAPGYGNLSYETTIVKQMITPFSGQGTAANFNQDNRSSGCRKLE